MPVNIEKLTLLAFDQPTCFVDIERRVNDIDPWEKW
jgi:hypothetical protein